ncbi:hypothetical protein GCM10010406_52980 [Streptomyces thermolineatus]|uniref:Regulatory protein n=1 Tax=Streptomyces thermolineatus TaxID=44033 RepID=A0ABP6A3G4_9ACTN
MTIAKDPRPVRAPRTPAATSHSLTWPLPRGADAPARARRLTRKLLRDWGLDDEHTWRAEAVVSEMVANAVTRSRPDLNLTWQLVRKAGRPSIRVEISAGASAAVPSCSEHGPGHPVVTALAPRWGTAAQDDRHGCTRWAEIDPA